MASDAVTGVVALAQEAVSAPALPLRMSFWAPPCKESLPVPPRMMSLSPRPQRTSLPAVPVSLSFPAVPVLVQVGTGCQSGYSSMPRLLFSLTALSSLTVFITQISLLLSLRLLMKAMWAPSGDQAGDSSGTVFSVRRLGSLLPVLEVSGTAFMV